MLEASDLYLIKAEESLAGAESEFVNRRYNNCANRCYYSCFQAAISALARAGFRPQGRDGEWGHALVQARFAGDLVNRRKLYPAETRDVLARNLVLRLSGDYEEQPVTETESYRALRRTRGFVEALRPKGSETQ